MGRHPPFTHLFRKNSQPRMLAPAACCALFGVVCAEANASLIAVSYWSLDTTVIRSTPQGVQTDGAFFDQVQNPFVGSHFATIGLSTASSAYDFAWNDAGGSFRINVAHRAEDNSGSLIQSSSSGSIGFSTTRDLLLTVDAPYSYDMPAYGMDANMSIGVSDRPPTQHYFIGSAYQDTFLQSPLSGTLLVQGQSILPGGQTYNLSYLIRLNTRGTSGLFANGSGYFHFTLQEVPEPSTLALLLPAALTLRRRR